MRKEYDAHPERFRQGEERRASHILIQADKDAGEAVIKAAREKAKACSSRSRPTPPISPSWPRRIRRIRARRKRAVILASSAWRDGQAL
jgi:hypothetical protein